MGTAIACYLAQQGASLSAKNHAGKTPIDVITDPRVEELVKQFATAHAGITRAELGASDDLPLECLVCSEQRACIMFQPCQHTVACHECCIKMKRCLQCKMPITAKIGQDGRQLFSTSPRESGSKDPQTTLQRKLNEMEENILCSICMERRKDMAFMCGHTVCSMCGEELRICHMCRKPITKKISLYS